MPLKRKYRRYARRSRRQGKKMMRKYSRKAYVHRSLNPLPASQMVKLRYVCYNTIPHGALGVIGYQQYRANGAFDPEYAVGGHQPLHWDRYASLYNHYVVLGSKIHIDAWTEENATSYGAIVGVKVDDNASIGSTIINVLEHGRGYTKYRKLRQMADGEKSMVSFSKSWSAKKYFGVKDVKDNQDQIGALVNTTPAEQAYFNVFWGHPDGSTVMEDLNAVITIDYIILFTEPIDQPSS